MSYTMSRGDDDSEAVITGRQKSFLVVVSMMIGVIAAFQSYGILPYEMRDTRARLEAIEKSHSADRDVLVTLTAQLQSTREEVVLLRTEIRDLVKQLKTQ